MKWAIETGIQARVSMEQNQLVPDLDHQMENNPDPDQVK